MQKYCFVLLLSLGIFACSQEETNQLEIDQELIENYLAENNLSAELHSSGIYYHIENPGLGPSPNQFSTIVVRYRGQFLDGEVFDETEGDETWIGDLSFLVRGWQIGVPLLKKGGKGTFYLPSEFGYGENGNTAVPPNSVLIFDIELVDFVN